MYQLKLLQLLGIQEYENSVYLEIKIQLDEEAHVFWEVDSETALSLKRVSDFSTGYLYRLSFKTHKNKSSVTRHHLDQSIRMEFTCSDQYIEELTALKQLESIAGIDNLPFISRKLVKDTSQKSSQMLESEVKDGSVLKPRQKLSWIFTSLLITILAVFTTYTGHSILTGATELSKGEAIHAENPSAKTAISDGKEKVKEKPKTILLKENITIVEKPKTPFFALTEEVSSKLPKGMVALTFDDGPSQFTSDIVDILSGYGIGGTFFNVGTNVNKYPEQVKYVADHGFSIGTHSMTHANLAASSMAKQEQELLQSSAAIQAITGDEVVLFRPPFGAMNDTTKSIVGDQGKKIVLWNNDTRDWESRNAAKILDHIKTTDVSGSIILLHETQATVDALPAIIMYLLEQDLQIVTLH
jgi:peptidoglycan-N-acetylglucosamine deacetylase